MDNSKELIEFDCELINETARAYKVALLVGKKEKELWFGKSIAEVVANKKGTKLFVQRWVAEKEELL